MIWHATGSKAHASLRMNVRLPYEFGARTVRALGNNIEKTELLATESSKQLFY